MVRMMHQLLEKSHFVNGDVGAYFAWYISGVGLTPAGPGLPNVGGKS